MIKNNIIAKARQSRGLGEEEVAKSIGISRPTYRKIESGTVELTLSQADALSRILNITIEEIASVSNEAIAFSNSQEAFEKYKQIILNAIKFGSDSRDEKITKTKLAKLVYLADFTWYYLHNVPMSGMVYRKLQRGPVANEYFRALDELEEDGVIKRTLKGKAILLSLIENEVPQSKISMAEIDLIKKISLAWKNKSTTDIVHFTHEQLPWQICRDNEIISYGLITQEERKKVYGKIKL